MTSSHILGCKKKRDLVETWEIHTTKNEKFWSWAVLTIPNFWRFSSYYHSSMMENGYLKKKFNGQDWAFGGR
jgi:hypothetical protein